MNAKATSAELLMIVLLLAPFVYAGLIWQQLPATLTGHFGPDGRPDRYDSKNELAFVLGGMTVFLYLVFRLAPRFDPRINRNAGLYQKIRWTIMLFWAVFVGWFWTISWRGIAPGQLQTSLLVGVGLLLTQLGNLMNSLKPNYAVGIRTPWTLGSETVWRKTHHLGSRVLMAAGLLSIILTLTLPTAYAQKAFIIIIMAAALVPIVYSYVYYRQEKTQSTR